jgi:hypothetical protein
MFPASRFQSEILPVRAGDLGVVVTDGVTEAIEQDGVPSSDLIVGALQQANGRLLPEIACDSVMRLADCGRGPAGVTGWHDDRTVVSFMLQRAVGAGGAVGM